MFQSPGKVDIQSGEMRVVGAQREFRSGQGKEVFPERVHALSGQAAGPEEKPPESSGVDHCVGAVPEEGGRSGHQVLALQGPWKLRLCFEKALGCLGKQGKRTSLRRVEMR
jgi:hypothetical protein